MPSTITRLPSSDACARAPLVQTLLALLVFVLFSRLALRHVGESMFLADQADQLQNFEAFLRLAPDGLWGAIYGGTDPPAHSFGPLGAWLAGIPVVLGLGVTASHTIASLLIVGTAAGAFFVLWRADAVFGWLWLLLFLAVPAVWWNVAMQWSNTLLLAAGCALLAVTTLALARPSVARLWALGLVVLFALHLQLLAIAAVVPAAAVVLATWRAALTRPPGRRTRTGLGAATLLAAGPYGLAESMTGLANTRAMLAHTGAAGASGRGFGPEAFMQVLRIAADPTERLQAVGVDGSTAVALAVVVAAAALAAWIRASRGGARMGEQSSATLVTWLIGLSVLGSLALALFFLGVDRPILSRHYTSIFIPFYVVPPAALAAWLIRVVSRGARTLAGPVLGAVCLAMLAAVGTDLADRYWERTDWTYGNIVRAIDLLCGAGTAATVEGHGLATMAPGHAPVLRYLMSRRFVSCRYDPEADRLLVAARDAEYGAVHEGPEGRFELEQVEPPGIALYRRVAGP